jgi:hypothetical protein
MSLLIDCGDRLRWTSHRQGAKASRKLLQLAENGFAAKLMLKGHVANIAQQLLVYAANGVGKGSDEVLFGACIFRKARQHFFDVFGKTGHDFLLAVRGFDL